MNITLDKLKQSHDCSRIGGSACAFRGRHDDRTVKIYTGSHCNPTDYLRLCAYQVKEAYSLGWVKNSSDRLTLVMDHDIGCEGAIGVNNTPTCVSSNRQEKNCRQCSKPNDVGVKSCWMCGCDNPC